MSIDNDAPVIAYNGPISFTSQNRLGTQLVLTGTATDSSGIAAVEIKLDDGLWQNATYTGSTWSYLWNVGALDGDVVLAVRATDNAGVSTTISQTVSVDLKVAPVEDFGVSHNGAALSS